MNRAKFSEYLRDLLEDKDIDINHNLVLTKGFSEHTNQEHTNNVFSEKWEIYGESDEQEKAFKFQCDWYLKLYGFDTEQNLSNFLKSKKVIFDAGCGLGYKAAWLAKLAPDSLVIGMDFSDSTYQAAKTYGDAKTFFLLKAILPRLVFVIIVWISLAVIKS